MSRAKFNYAGGLINVVVTLVFYIVVPDLIVTALGYAIPELSLGTVRTVGITSTGLLLAVLAFCRGGFPRRSMMWALAGAGGSLFSAAYVYILLGTPASYTIPTGGTPIILTFDISFLALVIALVLSLNSVSNFLELADARRKWVEKQRLGVTEIAA